MAHVAPWKKKEVAKLAAMFTDNAVVGIAQIGGIPGPQMQEMRASLRGHCTVYGAKNRLVRLALEEAKKTRPGVEALEDKVDGQVAVIATDMNPFKLYKQLSAGATMAPVKGGAVAPCDITVKKGPTPFGPGPIVGEFQKVGIPAKIEGPKVVVTKEVTPVKAGDVVSPALANMLAKLEIKPVELKIDLQAAFEDGTMFTPDVLAVDDAAMLAKVQLAARIAHELALEAVWPTKSTIDTLIGRAYRTGRELSLQTNWITKDTAEPILGKAYKIALAAAMQNGVDLGDGQSAAAEAYAKVLASIGKKEGDLSEKEKEALKDHLALLQGVAAPAAAPAAEAEAPEEEEEEEVSEDEAAAGLGDLFG